MLSMEEEITYNIVSMYTTLPQGFMKTLLFTSLLFSFLFSLLSFSSISFACTDFSGRYLNDDTDNAIEYTIEQNRCESIKIGSSDLIADGKFRTQVETSAIKISLASSFIDYYLQVENALEYKTPFPPGMPQDMIPAKYVTLYTIDWKGNLAIDTTTYNTNNEVISSENTVHQKQ